MKETTQSNLKGGLHISSRVANAAELSVVFQPSRAEHLATTDHETNNGQKQVTKELQHSTTPGNSSNNNNNKNTTRAPSPQKKNLF